MLELTDAAEVKQAAIVIVLGYTGQLVSFFPSRRLLTMLSGLEDQYTYWLELGLSLESLLCFSA